MADRKIGLRRLHDTLVLPPRQPLEVRNAVAQLPEKSQQLMGLLFAEDKVCYDDVARKIGRPKGSIGPTRQRCLARLLEILEAEPAQRTA